MSQETIRLYPGDIFMGARGYYFYFLFYREPSPTFSYESITFASYVYYRSYSSDAEPYRFAFSYEIYDADDNITDEKFIR